MAKRKTALALLIAFPAFLAYADIAIEGDLQREYTAQQGQRIEGVITIVNLGAKSSEAKLYQEDYRFNADGQNFFDQPGSQARSNALWTSFSPKTILVPAGEKVNVNYSIQVPQSAALSGSYWSVLFVEEAIAPMKNAETGVSINQNIRYGIQLIVNLGSTGSTELAFQNAKLVKEGDAAVFTVDISNKGERSVVPKIGLELFDEKGKSALKLDAALTRIHPGCVYRYRFILPAGLPQKDYKALLIADCGENKVFGTNVNLKLRP
jgi:hypothetical protein